MQLVGGKDTSDILEIVILSPHKELLALSSGSEAIVRPLIAHN
jgi:hypothetical protein